MTRISFWYEAGQLTTLAAQLVIVNTVVVYTVDVTRSSPPAEVDEFVSGNLKLDDDEEPDSETDGPVVILGTVTVVKVSVNPVSAGDVTVAESAVELPYEETVIVVAVCVE